MRSRPVFFMCGEAVAGPHQLPMNFSMTYNTHLIAHLRAHLPLEQNKLQQLNELKDGSRRRWTNLERGMAEDRKLERTFSRKASDSKIPVFLT